MTVDNLFLSQEKFDDGALRGRFWTPEKIVIEIQTVKTSKGIFLFSFDEWLTAGQVRSYFSRLKLARLKSTDEQISSIASNQEDTVDEAIEREGDDQADDAEVSQLIYSL